jgi:hypothetical protein
MGTELCDAFLRIELEADGGHFALPIELIEEESKPIAMPFKKCDDLAR